MSGYISGAGLERLSIADYLAYDAASTGYNWRVPAGYGTLIAASLPPGVALRLATPVEAIDLEAAGVSIVTRAGTHHRAKRHPHRLDRRDRRWDDQVAARAR